MAGLADRPANEFIDSLVRALFTFRGNEQFDDDVCLICIEV
jgi:serine phosphatase RsbU (regulator of sigma subunit)